MPYNVLNRQLGIRQSYGESGSGSSSAPDRIGVGVWFGFDVLISPVLALPRRDQRLSIVMPAQKAQTAMRREVRVQTTRVFERKRSVFIPNCP